MNFLLAPLRFYAWTVIGLLIIMAVGDALAAVGSILAPIVHLLAPIWHAAVYLHNQLPISVTDELMLTVITTFCTMGWIGFLRPWLHEAAAESSEPETASPAQLQDRVRTSPAKSNAERRAAMPVALPPPMIRL